MGSSRLPVTLALLVVTTVILVGCDADAPALEDTSTVESTPTLGTTSGPSVPGQLDRTPGLETPTRLPPRAIPTPIAPEAVITPPVPLDGEFLIKVVLPNTDANPDRFERIVLRDGEVQEREVVLQATDLPYASGYLGGLNVAFPPMRTGGDVVTVVCHEAPCGGMDFASPDARTALLRTEDRGATWRDIADLEGAYWLTAWDAATERALLYQYPTDQAGLTSRRFFEWPSLEEAKPPALPDGPSSWPAFLGGGRVVWWWPGGRLVDADSAVLIDLSELHPDAEAGLAPLSSPDGEQVVVMWGSGRGNSYWTLLQMQADGSYQPVITLRAPAIGSGGYPYTWIGDGQFLTYGTFTHELLGTRGSTHFGFIPAVVDLHDGEVRPIEGFESSELIEQGSLPMAFEPA